MTDNEKIYFLKEEITKLYSIEGRTKSYIAKLFNVERKKLGDIINNEWKLKQAKKFYFKPSTQKFINKNKQKIISMMNQDKTNLDIVREVGGNISMITRIVESDKDVANANEKRNERKKIQHQESLENYKNKSYHEYGIDNLDGEKWEEIDGFDGYYISNYGRVKSYVERYNDYYLMRSSKNAVNCRLYVSLNKGLGKKKNLQISRLVGIYFVSGRTEEKNTINHKDGNVENNFYKNLEWVSQSENNTHSYRQLKRSKVRKNKSSFKKVIYKNKYEFKTVASLAKFIGKSETQIKRYLDEPEKHDIKIIT